MKALLTLALATVLALSEPAQAGVGHAGTITHGDVTFERTASSFDSTPEANLVGVTSGGADQLFGHGWWFRIGPDPETPLPTPTFSLYGGNESSIDWDNVDGGNFDAHEAAFVFDAGLTGTPGDGGYVAVFLTIHNPSLSNPLSITVFHYLDFDLQPNAGDDTASWVEFPSLIEIYDSPVVGSYRAESVTAHQVAAHPAIVNALNDGAVTQLNNGGTPFPAGDFSAANQWDLEIGLGGEATVGVVFAIGTTRRCNSDSGVFCDSFESGNRSFWSSSAP
jgi:hypothetical protein